MSVSSNMGDLRVRYRCDEAQKPSFDFIKRR